ncbi:unnamed protein product, partial [Hapterophycus canaliculatus]
MVKLRPRVQRTISNQGFPQSTDNFLRARRQNNKDQIIRENAEEMRPRNIHSSAIGSARAPTVPPVACLRLLGSVVLLCVAPFAHAHLGEEKIDC